MIYPQLVPCGSDLTWFHLVTETLAGERETYVVLYVVNEWVSLKGTPSISQAEFSQLIKAALWQIPPTKEGYTVFKLLEYFRKNRNN